MLTEQERNKFADYLEHEAATDQGMIEQCEKLSGMEPIIKKMNVERMAALVIARKLRSIETDIIS